VLLIRWLKARLFRFLGRRALRWKRVDWALANFQRAAEQEPGNLHTALQIAWCLYLLEKHELMLETCEQLLQKSPNLAAAHGYRALVLEKVGRTQEAIDAVRRALRIGLNAKDKDLAFWKYHLGLCLANLGYYAEAIEPLEQAIKLNPEHSAPRNRLGIAYRELERSEEAVKELQESIRLDPHGRIRITNWV
jgi:tetratricopeptide (TPR) repeat protein